MGRPVEPDKYQQAWKAQSSRTRVTVDADLVLKAVPRSRRNFRVLIFWRDVREVVVGLVLIPVWFYLGITASLPWTWWLSVPALVWMSGFMLVYRKRHMSKPSEPDEPLLSCVKNSLTEVEAQIWLLRNIFWWYLLPPSISISAFFFHVAWRLRAGGWLTVLGSVVVLEGTLAVTYGVLYFVNQYVARAQLEPQRQELLRLLASLKDETTSQVTGEYPILMRAKPRKWSRRQWVAWCLCFVAFLVIALGLFMLGYEPVASPLWFAAFLLIGIAGVMLVFGYILAFRHDRPPNGPSPPAPNRQGAKGG
jgi:hypothetical protein